MAQKFNNLDYGKTWMFCDECQCIINKRPDGTWEECKHDWRPNSPAGVLANQEKEFTYYPFEQNKAMINIFKGARCYQSPLELDALVKIVDSYRTNVIVEIGSFHGGTAAVFHGTFTYNKLICIDRDFSKWLAGDITTKIQGDTQDPATLEALKKELNGEPIDFLFIDGDHSAEGARNDWDKFSPLVRDGGVIAFHDTEAIPEVKALFAELPGKMKINIASYQGIGVIVK